MADYFTSDHFKLLNKWKGTIYDKSNPEQQKVYEELSQAFDVTKRWADAVQQILFPMGWAKTVRKPWRSVRLDAPIPGRVELR